MGETLANKFHVPEKFHNSLTSKVRNWWNNNSWSISSNIQTALTGLLSTICNVSIPEVDAQDTLFWKNSTNGILTLKETYNSFIKPFPQAIWKTFPWDIDSSLTHSMIDWRFLHHKLPTDDNLNIRGFSFPSVFNLCYSSYENDTHLFFDCCFTKKIWNWFTNIMQLNLVISSIDDCRKILSFNWSQQAKAVLQACIVCIFYQIWTTRNKSRFEDKNYHGKACVALISGHANLVGNNSNRVSNSIMTNFCFLKKFDINIKANKTLSTLEVLWTPPIYGGIKCNICGVTVGNPRTSACGVIFRDHDASHILSFTAFLGNESPENADFLVAIMALETEKSKNFSKLWIETGCIFVVNAFKNHALVPWKLWSRRLLCLDFSIKIDFMITLIYR